MEELAETFIEKLKYVYKIEDFKNSSITFQQISENLEFSFGF